ncbi:DUF397 domain-containing protein [Streptomyces venezuelae]|uniref:DUF397 domain-containing protein n=1 Tax=Streptomyces venezuelae TaxID=54571 RepID=A0A5P2AQL1_STRVZ|nr:DUF397 domain-containing protein [Streptomyces venezuelae]
MVPELHEGGSGGGRQPLLRSTGGSRPPPDDASGGECIEVAAHPTIIHVRDSKDPEGPQPAVAPASWASFVAYATV